MLLGRPRGPLTPFFWGGYLRLSKRKKQFARRSRSHSLKIEARRAAARPQAAAQPRRQAWLGAQAGEPPHEVDSLAAPSPTNLAGQHHEALGPVCLQLGVAPLLVAAGSLRLPKRCNTVVGGRMLNKGQWARRVREELDLANRPVHRLPTPTARTTRRLHWARRQEFLVTIAARVCRGAWGTVPTWQTSTTAAYRCPKGPTGEHSPPPALVRGFALKLRVGSPVLTPGRLPQGDDRLNVSLQPAAPVTSPATCTPPQAGRPCNLQPAPVGQQQPEDSSRAGRQWSRPKHLPPNGCTPQRALGPDGPAHLGHHHNGRLELQVAGRRRSTRRNASSCSMSSSRVSRAPTWEISLTGGTAAHRTVPGVGQPGFGPRRRRGMGANEFMNS